MTTAARTVLAERGLQPAPTRGDRVHAAVLGLGAAAIVGYWASFFTNGAVRTSDDPCWVDFEESFPLADAYVAVSGLAAARQVWRGQPSAVGLAIAAGSGATFLGLMDVLYNLRHGTYANRSPEAALEATLNVAVLTLGPLTMARLWRDRHRFGV